MTLSSRQLPILAVESAGSHPKSDSLAVEEPLEIRLGFGPANDRSRKAVSVTMRTPGHDAELAVGFLFSEGILTDAADVLDVVSDVAGNVVRVDLRPGVVVDFARLERHFYTTSSCGVCGKTSLDAVETVCEPISGHFRVPASVIHALPARLRESQPTFDLTGGLHAAAFFDASGKLLAVREDVGRHNAVDKLIGSAFRANETPLRDRILFVSGRAGFELIQKAAIAGVHVFAAVGAPTSLAVELAQRVGMTLLGFVRDGRFNVYAGEERVEVL
jgi:FdhD protein